MRLKSVILISCVTLMLLTAKTFAAERVAYTKHWLRGVPVHVVTVDLNSTYVNVSPAIARHGIGSSEGFGSMISRLRPAAAITGTFFCVNSLQPVGDIVVDSKLVHRGSVGTAICLTPDKRLDFLTPKHPREKEWAGFSSVMCSGPNLVRNASVCLNPWPEGFRSKSLYRKAQRTAIGVTKANKMLLVSVNRPILMGKLAKIMKDLGSVSAVNLDGGSSTALYCKGKVLSHPSRRMTNLIVVYESPTKFASIKSKLAPTPILAQTAPKSGG